MLKSMRTRFLLAVLCISSFAVFGQNSPPIPISNADYTATDAIGRKLPDYKQTGDLKPNKYVGLFYWLWHGQIRNSATNPDSINVTKILSENPDKTTWKMEDFYWDEPTYGFYRSLDPWVIKKHMGLIAAAGVDFIFLDLTNGEIYEPELTQLLEIIQNMRKNGINAPYVVPFLNFEYGWKIEKLYKAFYKPGKYDDVWFKWDGKPLMMSSRLKPGMLKDSTLMTEITDYYTWRPTWALFDDDRGPGGKWRFMDTHPQRPALDLAGKIEQYVVSKSMGAPLWNYKGKGSSSGLHFDPVLDKYWLANETGTGIFFNEQWNRADSINAPVLLVTGWNELKAGAWPTNKDLAGAKDFAFQGRKMNLGDMYFVDEFNREFNRDIEPIKDSYTDNFYYQFVSRMRTYKGMLPPQPVSSPTTININGDFSDWNKVTPVYKNFTVDINDRDFNSILPGLHYTNKTGRNHIVETRTTHDAKYAYFYVKTEQAISPCTDKNWMLLFIDADNDKQTGWEGYDYLINSLVNNTSNSTIKKWNGTNWRTLQNISYSVKDNQMEIKVPLSALKQKKQVSFNFHWADNIQKLNDINEFFVNGNCVPERRFDYHYSDSER